MDSLTEETDHQAFTDSSFSDQRLRRGGDHVIREGGWSERKRERREEIRCKDEGETVRMRERGTRDSDDESERDERQ